MHEDDAADARTTHTVNLGVLPWTLTFKRKRPTAKQKLFLWVIGGIGAWALTHIGDRLWELLWVFLEKGVRERWK